MKQGILRFISKFMPTRCFGIAGEQKNISPGWLEYLLPLFWQNEMIGTTHREIDDEYVGSIVDFVTLFSFSFLVPLSDIIQREVLSRLFRT